MYSHGPPPRPTGVQATPEASGDTIILTWAKPSFGGVAEHDVRYRVYDADEWMDWDEDVESPYVADDLMAGTMYMFEVRGVGATTRRALNDPDRDDLEGMAASISATAAGTPVPTLAEYGALSLGLFLTAGGIYYTRRRSQNVPLLTA